ncbi:hypothetical protein [Arthrobacter sp. A2-55]|uniref:hypothetical protein n=1 Tax=Arthrobacter sp. A2-55 TaxID=2897337 RepID=UPI0021CD8380|nr:hypothetical protein [Arthrobacter sp. A2-55]MCU6480828.1 hypothetical protein [Arthrobacter sp. A2-55]
MTDPATPRPVILRRLELSLAAWQLLAESAQTALKLPQPTDQPKGQEAGQSNGQAAVPLTEEAAAAAWAELAGLGLSPAAGEVQREWLAAVALLFAAPLTVAARATYQGTSTTSAIGLRSGRGIAVHQRQLSEATGAGTVVTGSEDLVEVTLFDEDKLWPALRRLLPPLDAVRAPAKAAPLGSTPAAVLGADTDLNALPEPADGLVRSEDANVTLSVTAAPEGGPAHVWAGMWSAKDGHLYSVRTRTAGTPDSTSTEALITEVPAGHIAHELIFAVVGGHDVLSAARAEAAR